jgi:Mg-chelatase subunit ChlD
LRGRGAQNGDRELPAWAVKVIAEENAKRTAKLDKARLRKPFEAKPRPVVPPQPQPVNEPPVRSLRSKGDATDAQNADRLADSSAPSWSAHGAREGLNKALAEVLKEVRAELAGKRSTAPAIDRIVPDAARASDHRDESDVREFPRPEKVLRLVPNGRANRALAQSVKRFVPVLGPYFSVTGAERALEERLAAGRRLLAGALKKHLAYGEARLFADLRLTEREQHAEVLVGVLIDTSDSMNTNGRLDRAKRLAALLADCLQECPDVESVFLGYNQNVYLCGDHEVYSIGSLEGAGKTNEAAALDYLRENYLDAPRRRKVVIVLSDGLPTACSVESVRWVVRTLEKEQGVRCLHAALSAEEHPAYGRRTSLAGEIDHALVRALGRTISALLRRRRQAAKPRSGSAVRSRSPLRSSFVATKSVWSRDSRFIRARKGEAKTPRRKRPRTPA